MKPVLIQTLMKRRQRKKVGTDPAIADMKKASDGMFAVILVVLIVIIVGSIGIGA